MLNLLHQCQRKIEQQSEQPDLDLRILVGHTNTMDIVRNEYEMEVAWSRVCREIRKSYERKQHHGDVSVCNTQDRYHV